MLRVVGRGVVTIFDGRDVVSNAHEARRTAPLLASGVVLHVLPAGSVFNLTDRDAGREAHARRRPVGGRGARGCGTRPDAVGSGHRRRRRVPDRAAPTAGQARHRERHRRRSLHEHSLARPVDPRDPCLPRGQHLVLRQGDPPRRRPRVARGVPHRHAARLHRHLLRMLPGLREHSCSRGRRGGFVERLNEGTWLGPRRRARRARSSSRRSATTSAAARPVRSRASRAATTSSTGTSTRTSAWRPARLAVRLVNHLVEADPELDWDAELEAFILRAERTAFGPSTQAILDEAVSRDIPWIRLNQHSLVQLGQGVHQKRIRATMTSATSAIAVDVASDKDLTTRLLGAAGLPVPQAGVGADRRPGRRGRRTGSATPSWSSRSTATTAGASASTCRTPTTCGRRSRSPRSSPGAAG